MRLAIPLTILLVFCACGSVEAPRSQYQFCVDLRFEKGLVKETLIRLGQRNNMRFSDRSEEAEKESRSLNKLDGQSRQSYPLIMMSIWQGSGPSLTVTNAGLPANQAVLGVTGRSAKEVKTLADAAVREFSGRWKLIPVPAGKGAHELPNCSELR